MNLEIMDQITLEDDKTYIIANTMNYKNKEYFLLVDISDETNIIIAYLDGDELVSIENVKEIIKLLGFFDTDSAINIINKEVFSDT